MKKFISVVLACVLVLSSIPAMVFSASAATTISLDTTVSVNCKSAGNWDVRKFTPTQDGIYIFSSTGSLDTLGYIALAEGEAENKDICDDGGSGQNFAVTYDMKAGTTYYLGSTVISGSVGTYSIKIVKFEVDDDTIKPLSVGVSTSVTTKLSYGERFFSCTPSTSGKYIFESSGSYDINGYVFDEYWRQIAYSADGGSAQNYKITLDLQGGKTYYFGYSTSSTESVSFNVLLYLSTYIKSVTLISAPVKTSYIKGIDATSITGTTAYHVDLNLSGFEFRVNYSNGSYVDKSYNSNASLRGLECETSRNLNSGANVVKFSYMSNYSSFTVNISDSPVASLEIVQMPDKTIYYDEDATKDLDGNMVFHISLTGLVLKVNFKDGTSSNLSVSSQYGEEIDYFFFEHTIPSADMVLGNNAMNITYYGVSIAFNIKYSLNSDNWEFQVIDDSYVELTKYIGTDKEAVIPDTLYGYDVTAIGAECFKGNTTLTSVRMTDKIVSIGDKAFYQCSSVKELTLPKNLTSVGLNSFFGMTGVEKLNWNSVNLTYERANDVFAYLGNSTENGTTVEFSYDCVAIPESAFYMSNTSYNTNVTKVIIGENVASIGNNAFRECNNLKDVEWNANKLTTALGAVNNIWLNSATNGSFTVEFGEFVETIPTYLFYSSNSTRCPRISSVTVNGKNTVVQTNAFKNNSAVSAVYNCWYDDNSSFNSMYDYCVSAGFNYVLMDSPVESIYIYSQATKTEYICGEALDLSGLSVYAIYADGSKVDVTSKITVSGFDNANAGNQTLTISYKFIDKTVTASYDILMLEEPIVLDSISITSLPNKLSYYAGDIFDDTGLVVTANYTNGFTQNVTSRVFVSDYDMSEIGTQSVLITYTENAIIRTASFDISVIAITLQKVEITSPASETVFVVGSVFNPDGLKLTATYNNGATADVTAFVEYSGYDMNTVGTQTIKASYSENGVNAFDTYDIIVNGPKLTEIEITTQPSKKTFIVGDEFTSDGLKITATYENGATRDVTALVTLSGYDTDYAGSQIVQISYTEDNITKTASYEINVGAVTLTGVVIDATPTATQYQNTEFIKDGLKVHAVYNNNSAADISSRVALSGIDMANYGEQTVTVSYTEGGVTKSASFKVNIVKQTLTSFEITTLPTTKNYRCGDTFSSQGFTALAKYNSGLSKSLGDDDVVFSNYNMNKSGNQSVSVTYTDGDKSLNAQFSIYVENYETSVEITTLPAKTSYFLGNSIDISGMVVSAVMADGSAELINNSLLQISVSKFTSVGDKQVTVTYTSPLTSKSYNMNFSVKVSEWLSYIEISTKPTKTTFFYGDTFSSQGIVVKAHYGDLSTKDVTASAVISGYNMVNCAEQNVNVSYTENGESKSTSYAITVKNYPTSIYVKHSPTKLVYYIGESLDLTGMVVAAKMANGTETIITDSVTHSAFSSASVGIKSVTLFYTSPEKGNILMSSFNVSVGLSVSKLTLISMPKKLNYYIGESLDLSGIVLNAEMSDGSIQQISKDDVTVSGFDNTVASEQVVTLTYTYAKSSASAEISVKVAEKPYVTGVGIISLPSKTSYQVGEDADYSGLSAVLYYSDGSQMALASSQYTLSGFESATAGTKTITLTYEESADKRFSDTFTITVEESLLSRCDVDKNGTVDVSDVATVLLQANYGKEVSSALNARADVDNDGSVSVSDVAQILLSEHYGLSV